MTLGEAILRLSEWPDQTTIYALRSNGHWTADSPTIVCESDSGEMPQRAHDLGLDYCLEVDLAREAIGVAIKWFGTASLTLDQMVAAVIYYAENDAYIPQLPIA